MRSCIDKIAVIPEEEVRQLSWPLIATRLEGHRGVLIPRNGLLDGGSLSVSLTPFCDHTVMFSTKDLSEAGFLPEESRGESAWLVGIDILKSIAGLLLHTEYGNGLGDDYEPEILRGLGFCHMTFPGIDRIDLTCQPDERNLDHPESMLGDKLCSIRILYWGQSYADPKFTVKAVSSVFFN